jgi:hypothetical protein
VKAHDILFAGLVLAAGLVYEAMALWMPRGRIGQPGPGFFPMIVGAFLVLTAAGCLLQALLARRTEGPAARTAAEPGAANRQLSRVWLLIGCLVLYGVALQPVGFPVALLLFLVVSIWIFGYRKWLPTLGIAAALTAVSYLVFVVWLKVPLPLGILSDLLD